METLAMIAVICAICMVLIVLTIGIEGIVDIFRGRADGRRKIIGVTLLIGLTVGAIVLFNYLVTLGF